MVPNLYPNSIFLHYRIDLEVMVGSLDCWCPRDIELPLLYVRQVNLLRRRTVDIVLIGVRCGVVL